MSAKLGGYYADRGGMFMAADLKRSSKQKVSYVQVVEQVLGPASVGEDGAAIPGSREVIGTKTRTVSTICRLSARDIHRLATSR